MTEPKTPEYKSPHRVRIEGNGFPASTRITDAETGQQIGPVVAYSVTHRANEMAHAFIYLGAPKLALECDATIVRPEGTHPEIVSEMYFAATHKRVGRLTCCVLNLRNGLAVTGDHLRETEDVDDEADRKAAKEHALERLKQFNEGTLHVGFSFDAGHNAAFSKGYTVLE